MKFALSFGLFILLFSSCEKPEPFITPVNPKATITPDSFKTYTIRQGRQYCDSNPFAKVNYATLNFVVKFDSSAIYTTAGAANQNDINKLYGFSDNNSLHHLYSARFGWRWSDKALRLFAYIYNNGNRISKELGVISIGTENNCAIKIDGGQYIFSLNNITDTLPRLSSTTTAEGYKLYPYFGGDEAAPHNINILIKEL